MDSSSLPEPMTPEQPTTNPLVTELAGAPSTNPGPIITSEPEKPESPPPKKHRYTLDVAVAILLIVLIGVALYIVNNYIKPNNQATPVSAKKDIQVLRVSIESPLSNTIYPNTQADDTEIMINQQVFEGLCNLEQQTKIVPQLATSWTNPDNNTWIFKIRPNVKFHDGNTLTAKQVKASIDQSKNYFGGQNLATTIKSVDVIDTYTVKITTNGPDPLLTNKLAELYIWDTDANKTGDSATGTGPYTISTNNKNLVVLKAFDGYYAGHVYTREVDITESTSDAMTKLAITNKADELISSAVTGSAGEIGSYKHQVVEQNGTHHVVFNTLRKSSPLTKLVIRQALAQATNKSALVIIRATTSPLSNQTIPVGIPGYNPAIQALPFDPIAAKAAIIAAGYPKGFALTFTYYSFVQNLAVELKKEYAAVGVTLNLDPESDQSILIHKAIGGGTDMYYNSSSSSLLDGTDILSDFIDSANYKNPALDALNNQAATTLDPAARVALLQQMSKVLADDQGDIPLFATSSNNLYVASNVHIAQDTQASAQIGSYFWKIYSE
jgi:peptide/nickel transport system substrate-binding protein